MTARASALIQGKKPSFWSAAEGSAEKPAVNVLHLPGSPLGELPDWGLPRGRDRFAAILFP